MRSKVTLIIRELGRVLARSNASIKDEFDEKLIEDIANLIAESHAKRDKNNIEIRPNDRKSQKYYLKDSKKIARRVIKELISS